MKLRMLLAEAVAQLRNSKIENAVRDARALVSFAVNVPSDRLTLCAEDTVNAANIQRSKEVITRRCEGCPVSRIIGKRLFWGREFVVTRDVLDPRGDTETLIALSLQSPARRILDLGTGTGAIGITLATEWSDATLIASDLSDAALKVAERNAKRLGVSERCQFMKSDWFSAIEGTFDLIVSNPPYISRTEWEGLAKEVKDYDPLIALTHGEDALYVYREISSNAMRYLTPDGRLLLEIGHTQGIAVSNLLNQDGYQNISVHLDLEKRDRVVSCSAPV